MKVEVDDYSPLEHRLADSFARVSEEQTLIQREREEVENNVNDRPATSEPT